MYYMDTEIYNIQYYCAWGLVLGGVGCVLVIVSALGHLYILFRNLHATKNDVNDYQTFKGANQGIVLQLPYTSIVPPGCNKTFAFNVPFFQQSSRCSFISCPKEKKWPNNHIIFCFVEEEFWSGIKSLSCYVKIYF